MGLTLYTAVRFDSVVLAEWVVVGVQLRQYQMPPTLYCHQVVTIVRGTEVERRFLNYSTCTSGNGGFNDDSMFQVASDTCRRFIGRHVGDVVLSGPSINEKVSLRR